MSSPGRPADPGAAEPFSVPPYQSVSALFRERARELDDRPAFHSLAEGGARAPETVSWARWADESRAVTASLVEQGIGTGDAVAIFAGNRPLWPIAEMGIVGSGALSVGLYPSSAPEQVRQVLSDCRARVVVVDTAERLRRLLSVRDELPHLGRIVVQDAAAEVDGLEATADAGIPAVGWDRWVEGGRRALADTRLRRDVDRRWSAAEPEDDAVLIYTSGSTGRPKGARLSHRYLMSSAASIRQTLALRRTDRSLSYLPFCHAAERVFGLYTRILCGMECGMVEDRRRLWDAARSYEPTLFGGLPRFFEKIHHGVRRDGRSVEEFLGGSIRLVTSGGAPLDPTVVDGLRNAGLLVLGAYGLTEHLCVAMNRPDRHALDSSGPPMPGTTLRIADDGEILVERGPLTFSGYLGLPEETRDAFTRDGVWLRTGDLGEVDGKGFLRVTGRKKELLALSTGKMVAPRPVESRLASDPWVEDAVLVGEGRKFVGALIVPDREAVEAWAAREGVRGDLAELLRRPEVRRRLRVAVARVNRDLSRSERVRRFVLLERPLSREAEELTPTGKVRRFRVLETRRSEVEALYGGDGSGSVIDAGEPGAVGEDRREAGEGRSRG